MRAVLAATVAAVADASGAAYYQKYQDAACTVPFAGAAHQYIGAPLDACVIRSKTGTVALPFPYLKASLILNGTAVQWDYHTTDDCAGTPAFSLPSLTGGCSPSSSGGYYYTEVTAEPFTGMVQYKKFDDGNCTAQSNTTTSFGFYGLAGMCLDTHARGGRNAAHQYITGKCVASGLEATMGDDCATANATMTLPTDACTASADGGYYIAECVTDFLAVTTTLAPTTTTTTTTAAGAAYYQKYQDAACTVPFAGAAHQYIGAPLEKCVIASKTGTIPLPFPYLKAALIMNGTAVQWDYHMTPDCAGTPAFSLPSLTGGCSPSSSGGYYYTEVTAEPFTGMVQYQKYDDGNCTVQSNTTTSFGFSGLAGMCLDTHARGGRNAAHQYITGKCVASGLETTMGDDCATANVTNTVPTDACTASTDGGYYIAQCVTDMIATTTTTTAAPTTVAPNTTTDAPTTTVAATTTTEAVNTTVVPTTTTTTTPVVVVSTVAGSFSVAEDLPANTTAADLMASAAYVEAKEKGLASALGVDSKYVTVTGFTFSRRQLSARSLAAVSVTTNYEVGVAPTASNSTDELVNSMLAKLADPAVAAQIKTEINSKLAVADFTGDATFASAPSVTGTVALTTPTATANAALITSGPFSFTQHTDAACATGTPVSGNVGECVTSGAYAIKVLACTDTGLTYVVGNACDDLTMAEWTIPLSNTCTAAHGANWVAACGAGAALPADTVASAASVSSVAASALIAVAVATLL